MRAVVYDRYGPPDVLRLDDVARPVPKEDEVLIKVRATTVTRTDCGIRQGKPFISRLFSGLLRPRWRILGSELAGEVEAAGPAVTEFKAGDLVFGENAWRLGAHAEFVCMRERGPLARKPAGMSFEEAAAVCDGVILALMCLRPADVRKGGASSSTAHRAPSARQRFSWPGTSMPMSPRCATPSVLCDPLAHRHARDRRRGATGSHAVAGVVRDRVLSA